MDLNIKNMVCPRCIMAVDAIIRGMGLHPVHISLGLVTLSEKELTKADRHKLDTALRQIGFELLDEARGKLTEKIKTVIVNKIFHDEVQNEKVNWSAYLADKCAHAYGHLSAVFSEEEHVTIEQFIIGQKIERVKELLSYNELNLNEIAWKMGYSSAAHLSTQFKQVTGQSPSAYKKAGISRKPIGETSSRKARG